MTAQDGKSTPRPDAERAAWLLHPISAIGRLKIDSCQYEELRAEAVALREERDGLRRQVEKSPQHGSIYRWLDENKDKTVKDISDANGLLERKCNGLHQENDRLRASIRRAIDTGMVTGQALSDLRDALDEDA